MSAFKSIMDASEQMEPLNLSLNGSGAKPMQPQADDGIAFARKRSLSQKSRSPRRNPTRKARETQRFAEYVHESFGEDDCRELDELDLENREDFTEDWKAEKVPRRGRQRRFFGRRGGRKKRSQIEEGSKDSVAELAPLIEENLLLSKTYISNVQTLNKLVEESENSKSNRIAIAVDILRNQILLLCLTKNLETSAELVQYLFK